MNNEDQLDRLLRAPLAPVADDGFSARVMAHVSHARERRPWLETGALLFTGAILVAVLPAAALSDWIGRFGYNIGTSLPVALAAFALAVTYSCTRVFVD